jgi:hypothetical protein
MAKRNAKREIVAALTKELEASGFPVDEKTNELLKALREGRTFPTQSKKGAEELLLGILGMMIKRSYKTGHIKTDSQLESELQQIEGLRYKMRPAIAQAFSELLEALPNKPRGPKPKLTNAQKQSACSTIDAFLKNGMTTKSAVGRVAQQFKVSPRMIRRAWESRGR